MTHAQAALDAFPGSIAWTAEGGYACYPDGRERKLFSPGKLLKKRTNERGRCTYARYEWSDGSQLEFRYSESRGGHCHLVEV